MKIIIVGTAYPMRGAFAQLNAILYSYLNKKYDVKIYSFIRQYPKLFFPGKTQEEKGEELVKVPVENNIISIDSINPFNWISVGKRIADEKPALIIFRYWIPFFAPCFAAISYVAKKRSKAKVLFICDNVIPHEKRVGDTFLTKIAFNQADYFLVQSKSVEDDLLKFSKDKPYKVSFHPIYNIFGEKLSKFEAREFIKKEYGTDITNNKVLLFFGYVRKYKGLSYLLKAMPGILKNNNDVKLLIVGEFYDDEEQYRKEIKDLGLENNVIVLSDFVPNERVRYFFSASDVVLLPYSSATQSGITHIAHFYDKPVIATDVGGLSESVHDGKTGFVIKPEDPEAIKDAVTKFYNENLEERFSAAVAEEKKKYDWDNFIKDIEDLTNISNN
jgi:glycosyltransferase involved in cell wall biosynthesis